MIEAVIWDIGNVLIEWQPERYYDARIGRQAREAMFAAVDLHGMNERVDRGEDFRDTIYGTADRYPDHAESIRLWHDDWANVAGPAISRSVALLRALRSKGVPCHALTNFGVGSFAVACREWPFLTEFDHAFVSGHLWVTKPDPAIYAAVERETKLDPGTLLFADDRDENLAAAARRGWQVHHFDGPDGWAARLVDEGLLTRAEAA